MEGVQHPRTESASTRVLDVEGLRREIPLLERWIYMNTGTSGPFPVAVTEAQIDWIRRLERDGGGSPAVWQAMNSLLERTREAWARMLGAPAVGDIALTHNTSEGLALVAAALDWQLGDEVIVSDLEHISGLLPWAHLQRRHGVVVRFLETREGNLTVADVQAAITPRTRLICFSHVSYSTGAILPVQELCRLARERGILTLIDGAQAVGQFPVNVAELGCDFYAAPGQKWLLGPEGTGALYVKAEHLPRLTPPLVGWASAARMFVSFSGEEEEWLHPDARRFEVATPPLVAVAGIEAALKFMENLGMEAVWNRVSGLARECRRRLAELPGVRVWGIDEPDQFSGLVTFSLEQEGAPAQLVSPGEDGTTSGSGEEGEARDEAGGPLTPEAVVERLFREHGIVCRSIPHPRGVRLSLHAFNTEEEIQQVCGALGLLLDSQR